MKREGYACGEKEEKAVKARNFYKIIFSTFKLDKLREAHSGKLSDYLTWIVIGLAILILIFVIGYA